MELIKYYLTPDTYLRDLLSPFHYQTLKRTYYDCFHQDVTHYPSGFIYLLVNQVDGVIATAFITSEPIQNIPSMYTNTYSNKNTWYLYNVCTYSPYRGQHLMEDLLLDIFTELVDDYGVPTNIILNVDSKNNSAIKLYNRLGFDYLDQTDRYLILIKKMI